MDHVGPSGIAKDLNFNLAHLKNVKVFHRPDVILIIFQRLDVENRMAEDKSE